MLEKTCVYSLDTTGPWGSENGGARCGPGDPRSFHHGLPRGQSGSSQASARPCQVLRGTVKPQPSPSQAPAQASTRPGQKVPIQNCRKNEQQFEDRSVLQNTSDIILSCWLSFGVNKYGSSTQLCFCFLHGCCCGTHTDMAPALLLIQTITFSCQIILCFLD